MLRKVMAVFTVLLLAVSIGACKKQEAKPQLPPGHPAMPGMEGQMPPSGMQPGMQNMPKVERQIIVSKEIKAKYKSVKIAVMDKATQKTKDYTVAVGGSLTVPNTKITIKVLAFLPDFRMGDKEITSASDALNNPAAQVQITEPGKEEWKGWLFSLQPGVHSFQHDKIAVTLAGAGK